MPAFKPFVPHGPLPFVVWRAADVEVDVRDFAAEYGFTAGSAQHNFFAAPPAGAAVVLLHTSAGAPPRHLADPAVVARAFGTVSARGLGELWHVGVRKAHPLGAARGRWGARGVVPGPPGPAGRATWVSEADGARVTPARAEAAVRGSPNPYALECLVRFGEALACATLAQNPALPCGHLFHGHYDQKADPAAMLLYRALGFQRGAGLCHYAWERAAGPDLAASHAAALAKMRAGEAVVP